MKKIRNSHVGLLLTFLLFFVIGNLASPISCAQNDGSWNSPYTIEQAMVNQTGSSKTVMGYIVGQPTATNTVITSNFPNDFALAIADTAEQRDITKMLYIQIPSNYRSSFGLKANPSLLGKQIKVTGNLTAYFSHAGAKNISKMEIAIGATTPDTPNSGTTSPSIDAYYSNAKGKTGAALRTALHQIIDDHTEISYSAVWEALKITDQDPKNSKNVILLYTGRSQSKSLNGSNVDDWNREHVWAKSHGDFGTSMGPGTDLHHLRPTDVSVNSTRGNKDFDEGGTADVEAILCKTDGDSWEPRDAVKGDVARMLFYMAVRYEGDSDEPDLELNNNVNNGSSPYMGKLSVLLKWNQQDPPDDFERNRNEVIYTKYQHNRNPFIDHPEWVNQIWN